MSVMMDQINSTGQVFIDFVIPMLIQSSFLILILLFVDVLLRKKVRAGFRYWIWILVLVKLALPTSLSTPVSLGRWFGDEIALMDIGTTAHDAVEIPTNMDTPIKNPTTLDIESSSSVSKPDSLPGKSISHITWQGLAFLVWLVVVIVMLLLFLQRSLFVRKLVAQSQKVDDDMNDTLEDCCNFMRIKTKVGVKISKTATSPAVCGLFKPVILLPQNMMPSLDASQLRVVLMHELVHIKRHDLLVNLGQTLLQILYFYNPLFWLANAIIRKIREQAVDEAVLITMGEKAQLYPQTLVNVAKLAFKGPTLSLRLIGVVESKSLFEWRIRTMLNRPIPKSSKLGVLGTIMIVAVAAVLLPMAKAEKSGEKSAPVRGENLEEYTKPLHQAAADGDIEQVKRLIAQGADIDAKEKGDKGKTPLQLACENGHVEIARLFIAHGADVNKKTGGWNLTALHVACEKGHVEVVKLLLASGAHLNVWAGWGETPFSYAMISGTVIDKALLELFVEKGVSVPPIHLAAYNGDLAEVKRLVGEGVNINSTGAHKLTALHFAVHSGQSEVAEYLLSRGADVNARDSSDRTPLHHAAIHPNTKIADLLVANGADLGALSRREGTPLHMAVEHRQRGMIELLVSKGADINKKSRVGPPPLSWALWTEDVETLKLLISKGADINANDSYSDGYTPLHWAVLLHSTDLVKLLIASGANVNNKDGKGRTALDLAKEQGQAEIVELLRKHEVKQETSAKPDTNDAQPEKSLHQMAADGDIEQVKKLIAQGADVNAKDEKGSAALNWAAARGHREVAELLIGAGADINASGAKGSTALSSAILSDHVDVVRLLVAKGADVNAQSGDRTALTWAITALGKNDREIVELLLNRGANIHLEDKKGGSTPLRWAAFIGSGPVFEVVLARVTDPNTVHLAACKGDLTKVKTLVQGGADVNLRDGFGCTPLHWAALASTNNVADFLLTEGADVNAKDSSGLSPLSGARRLDMIALLVSKGAEVDIKGGAGYTRMHMACLKREKDIAAFLISKGADVNTKNNWGTTPLLNASANGHLELVQLLIDNGADVNTRYWNGTPLLAAAADGHTDVVELLIAKGADINMSDDRGRTPLAAAKQQGHSQIVELLRKHDAKE